VDGLFVKVDVTSDEVRAMSRPPSISTALDIAFNNAVSADRRRLDRTTGSTCGSGSRTSTSPRVPVRKYAIEHMRPSGRGSIINTASFVAVMGSATSQISYTAAGACSR